MRVATNDAVFIGVIVTSSPLFSVRSHPAVAAWGTGDAPSSSPMKYCSMAIGNQAVQTQAPFREHARASTSGTEVRISDWLGVIMRLVCYSILPQ
jgi:hypothetical protein